MKMRIAVLVLCVFALSLSAAYAGTVNMKVADLTTYGWKATAKSSVAEPGASVQDKLNYAGSNGIQFSPKRSVSNDRAYAAISTSAFQGVAISSITSLSIRTFGAEGDGSAWQPPTFQLWLYKAPTNLSLRPIVYLPWTGGNARAPGSWNTYNALTAGNWYCPWTGATYANWAAVVAGIPEGFISDAAAGANTPTGQAFEVGALPAFNETITYFSSARGTVDWFDVGISGVTTRYDLGEVPVPEPGSILALTMGLVGFVGLRRKR